MTDENIIKKTNHSADKTTVAGMRYQTLYGLYAFFKLRGEYTNLSIRFEKEDDIVLLTDNNPVILAQVKHHGYAAKPKKIINSSKDAWKTIGIWIDQFKSPGYERVQFHLITTETVADRSIFCRLSHERKKRRFEPGDIVSKLDKYCEGEIDKNADGDMNKYYSTYLNLNQEDKLNLVNRITIFDASPNLDEIDYHIKQYVASMCRPEDVDRAYNDIKSWWENRSNDQILEGGDDVITDIEFSVAEEKIRKAYSTSILQTKNHTLPQEECKSLMRNVFSEQLRFIELDDDEILDAVNDYYFAKYNRLDWLAASRVYPDELNNYEESLENSWKKHFNRNKRDLTDESTETELIARGRNTYDSCSQLTLQISESKKIDTNVERITLGSFHILADLREHEEIPRIGWHPKYSEKLMKMRKEVEL